MGEGKGRVRLNVCVCLRVRGVCIILVCAGICECHWGCMCVCVCLCVCSLRRCVSSSPPLARVQHFLYAEVNDLAVQSHSPVRAPSPTATGGLANWYPAERKSRGRKRWEDEGQRKSEWKRRDHESVVSPRKRTLKSLLSSGLLSRFLNSDHRPR